MTKAAASVHRPGAAAAGPAAAAAAAAAASRTAPGATGADMTGGDALAAGRSSPEFSRVVVFSPLSALDVTPGQPDPPASGPRAERLAHLVMHAGVDVPVQLIERHERAMNELLQPGAGAVPLHQRITEAGGSLQLVYAAFLMASPADPVDVSPACQQVSSRLVGHARLINHIHHHLAVPPDPDAFLRLTQQLPPSRLERRP